MNLAPILLFTYNRPAHTKATVEALKKNILANKSELYVFSDGPKDKVSQQQVANVRKYLHSIKGFKQIYIKERLSNKGLAYSIINGVTTIIEKYEKVIVLEDDIVPSQGFLSYMNDALDIYENNPNVWHINAHLPLTSKLIPLPDTFFLHFMNCWGWGTWKRAWENANWNSHELYAMLKNPEIYKSFSLNGTLDFKTQLEDIIDGKKDTWAIKWYTTIVANKGLCLFPRITLTKNNGFDGTGENCLDVEQFNNYQPFTFIEVKKRKTKISTRGYHYLRRYYRYGAKSGLRKIFQYYFARLKITIRKWIKKHT